MPTDFYGRVMMVFQRYGMSMVQGAGTSLQLALAYPSEAGGVAASAVKFLGVFAPTQLPLAVIEGLITVVILIGLETYAGPELRSIGFLKGSIRNKKGER